MKLAHIADPHLGVRQYHRQTAAGINQREADVAHAFRVAVDGVIAARPDAVVVAGDLFHSVRPTNAAIVFAFRQFQRLREALPAAPIVLIAGNHDTPRSTETGSILSLFEELGVDVAFEEARRLVYSALDLSVLAVPHQALAGSERPSLRPEGSQRHRVLVLHGEVEGVFPADRSAAEYGGALIHLRDLSAGEWTYVALGHYHVQHELAPRTWYAGSLEYVSPNIWGELRDEAEHGRPGKGWLLVDLERGTAAAQPVPPARDILDLEPILAEGLAAPAINGLITERLHAVSGGITDRIVRLVVREIPRHIARELDHTAIRAFKSEALHLHLDLRRPEVNRTTGVGSPGKRQTLPELVHSYLARRPLPGELDRDAFVRLGDELMDAVERDVAGT
ncbi:MAG: exonuclease SbcCD subunit D [Gemmatimonadales bacterium]|nr:exonuclease SbcCD subunit D [Gemmatimonadales bacterium]MDQ3427267.1 exonuclease SbcCD subunit D [Gemmatimonadota bacterium]